MTHKHILSAAILAITLFVKANGQEITQVIRGNIIDVESQTPIAFATVTIPTTYPPLGTTID